MKAGQIWRSKEVRGVFLSILGVDGDNVLVTFELSKLSPRRTYNYNADYLNQYYESTDTDLTFKISY
jgi:hypothetical protein